MVDLEIVRVSGSFAPIAAHLTTPELVKWRPSFIHVIAYVLCWPLWFSIFLIPAGENSDCLPVSAITIVTAFFCTLRGSKLLMRYLAAGMFEPFWKNLREKRREKIVWILNNIIIMLTHMVILIWYLTSQEQSMTEGTFEFNMENCPQPTVACLVSLWHLFTKMVYELLTRGAMMSKGLIAHHVFASFSILIFGEPSIANHVTNSFFLGTFLWIVLGEICIVVVYPALIFSGLYHDSAIRQFFCYVWVLVSGLIVVALCFCVMPGFVIWSN